MTEIPSPYNFVAVEDKVALAEAPGRISHDVPFKVGMSGWLDLEIEATTPIYTRAAGDFQDYRANRFVADCEAVVGQASSQREIEDTWKSHPDFQAFTDCYRLPDGRPALPGTSLRGPIRNLIEMLTNSRLGPVNERRYAVRDLNNTDRTLYGGWMTAMGRSPKGKQTFTPAPRAGWLQVIEGQWHITPCSFARVSQLHLEERKGGLNFRGCKTAEDKYRRWSSQLGSPSLEVRFSITEEGRDGGIVLDRATLSDRGEYDGTLVFSGQPNRKKHLEFIFYHRGKSKAQPVRVPDQAINWFKQTHTDQQDEPTESWKFWLPKLQEGEPVPVFYLAYPSVSAVGPDRPTVSLDTPGAHLHAFGLAMMFRLAYRHTLREAIPASHRKDPAQDEMDFAEAIFGYQREGEDEGLRGRVSFGPCVAEGSPKQLPPVVTVLSSPKPTYYPNYLEQPFDPNNGHHLANGKTYKTLMNQDAKLRGWKFYPAHRDGTLPDPPLPPANDKGVRAYKTATAFRPLAAGTKFRGRVRFHNLRPAELGALVWALTWGGNAQLRHRLGMAKPLGYGCAKIRITGGHLAPNDPSQTILAWEQPATAPLSTAMQAFESAFSGRLQSPEIQQDLLGMADQNHGHALRYPTIKPHNEFADAKKARLVLPRWRVFANKTAGEARVNKNAPPPHQAGGGGQPQARPYFPNLPPQKSPAPKFHVGQVVECEVRKRDEAKSKATLKICAGGINDTGGLAPEAKARFAEIPPQGQKISMKITSAGSGGYQFAFPD